MLYLWVGLGGALGSILRAWVAITMAKVTGPQFPWGTILINIVGSFAIAFFGTVTMADGRLPASATMRTFFMVGVCGGFTTFSSFSLQTLELARDGRVAQAAGNVALSVAACLIAVTAGWYCARAINPVRTVVHAAMAPAARRTVVALLNRPETAPAVLAAAGRLLEGRGRIAALGIHPPAPQPLLPSEEVVTAERDVEVRAAAEAWNERLQPILADWQRTTGGVAAEWVEVDGNPASVVARYGQQAEATVVASRADDGGEHEREALHAALFASGRPVLVVPPGAPKPFGKVIAIAWKDDGRARAAVAAAAGLIERSEHVYVLHAEGARATSLPALPPKWRAVPHVVPARTGAVGAQLLEEAHRLGADLIVMGAYAHGEWREALLGGVTRFMLANADVSLLMRH